MTTVQTLGRGFDYPLKFKNGELELAEGDDSVRSALYHLFSTRYGERFMLPEFGTKLWRLLFEGARPEVLQLMSVYAREEVLRWIPRIARVEATATVVNDHEVRLVVEYWLRSRATPEMFVYPFYLEGYRV